jgi:hypothetical protein
MPDQGKRTKSEITRAAPPIVSVNAPYTANPDASFGIGCPGWTVHSSDDRSTLSLDANAALTSSDGNDGS